MRVTGSAERRIRREMQTVRAMIGISCRGIHGTRGGLCPACEDLWQYAQARVDHCPFGTEKPTCAQCTVHCYQAAMRERIRVVMRYAGPRMAWRHPLLSLFHLLDGRRPAPELPRRRAVPPAPTPSAPPR